MNPEDAQKLQAHIQGIAKILYKNTDKTNLVSLETIEKSVRRLEYKAVRLQGIYYNAAFADNQFLIDWINSQNLVNPLVCLGDGHSGVWKRA